MRKILLIILFLLPVFVFAQNPVIISQPYKFNKWVRVAGSLFSDSTLLSTDSSTRVLTTALGKRLFLKWTDTLSKIATKWDLQNLPALNYWSTSGLSNITGTTIISNPSNTIIIGDASTFKSAIAQTVSDTINSSNIITSKGSYWQSNLATTGRNAIVGVLRNSDQKTMQLRFNSNQDGSVNGVTKFYNSINHTPMYYSNIDTTYMSMDSAIVSSAWVKRRAKAIADSVSANKQNHLLFNVDDYGAIGDGVTNDRVAIQNAINAASLVHGTVTSSGKKYIITAGNGVCLHIDSAIQILGLSGNYSVNPADSSFNSGGSEWITTSRTDTLIKTTQTGLVYLGVAFLNNATSAPTGGYGIFMTKAGSFSMNRVVIKGFYTNLEVQQGVSWTIDDSRFINPVSRNLHVLSNTTPDQGDWSVSNTSFLTNNNATDAYLESSGGMKFVNCKFQPLLGNHSRFFVGIDVNAAAPGTSDLQVSNCSIEGFNGYGIRVQKQSGASFGNVTINGNQITAFATISGNAIFMDGIYGVAITGNSINDGNSNVNPGILLNNCIGGIAYPNAMAGWSTPISTTGTSAGNSPASIQYQPLLNGKPSTAAYTTGAIPFANAGNLFSERITNGIWWDDTNLRANIREIQIGNSASPQIGLVHGDNTNKGTGGGIEVSSSGTAANQFIALGKSTPTFTGHLFDWASSSNISIGSATDLNARLSVSGGVNSVAGIGRNVYLNGTVQPIANNDVLVGVDVASGFNTGTGFLTATITTNTTTAANGTYTAQAIVATSGSGTGGAATFVVAGGVVTSVTQTTGGISFAVGNTFTSTAVPGAVFTVASLGYNGVKQIALRLPAGTTALAPLQLTSGPLLTTPVSGVEEFLTDRRYFTQTTGTTRQTYAWLSDFPTLGGTYNSAQAQITINNGQTATTRAGLILANHTNAAIGSGIRLANSSNDLHNPTVQDELVIDNSTAVPMSFWINNVKVGGYTSGGTYQLPLLSTAGVLHNAGGTGNVSSSLIVNADITNSTIDLTTKVTGVLPSVNGGSSGANPTATAGKTAINGSATTFQRSDAAPAIDTTSTGFVTKSGLPASGRTYFGALAVNNNFLGTNTAKNFYSTSTAPSIAAGIGAGTSPTVTINGTNQDGVIVLTVGTLPATGLLFQCTMSDSFAYPNQCLPVFQSTTATNQTLSGITLKASGSPTAFALSTDTILVPGGIYAFYYHNGGY